LAPIECGHARQLSPVPLEENQEVFAAAGSSIPRIVAGTHHKADLNHAVFDLGSQLGLVGIVHDAANAVDPNAIAVRAVANKTICTAGFLPRNLAPFWRHWSGRVAPQTPL
jgi:hypothetical protein